MAGVSNTTGVSKTTGYVRLRQICLVAPHLDPVISDIAGILGLHVCYRDGNVAKYGLENALLPVDTILLEVVAPFQPGTAAGRFIEKTGGRGGYMAIFCCDDPDERGRHAEKMGVRVANVIDHAPYHGVQLHAAIRRMGNHVRGTHTDRVGMLAARIGIVTAEDRHVATAAAGLLDETSGRGPRLERRHHFEQNRIDRQ